MVIQKAIEEYEPGPGHEDTLDGYREWIEWRNAQEKAKHRRAIEEAARK
jgi:hypothetical protein